VVNKLGQEASEYLREKILDLYIISPQHLRELRKFYAAAL